MLIRRATPRDAAALADLGARTFRDTFAADNRPEDLDAYIAATYSDELQRREIEDRDCITLLVHEGDLLIGFAQVRRSAERWGSVEIVRFYVDRGWHGRGIAPRLMGEAYAAARELGGSDVWLGVWERNSRAIAFYAKCGFVDVGSHPFFVGSDLQTDRIMVLRVIPVA